MVQRLVLVLLLAGCSSLPDVERSFRECLAFQGSPKYTATAEMKQAECNR